MLSIINILDDYDELYKKISLILNGKQKSKVEQKKSPTLSVRKSNESIKSKNSSSSGQEKKKQIYDTFLKLPQSLFTNILKAKLVVLNCDRMIIESLTSVFLAKNSIALNCLLESIGNTKYIYFILLTYSFKDYELYEIEKKRENELKEIQRKEEILNEILDMSADEFDNLSNNKLAIYSDFLKNRKLQSKPKKLEKNNSNKSMVSSKKIVKGIKNIFAEAQLCM